MDTSLNIKIGDLNFRLLSLHATEAKLFQVYVPVANGEKRYHLVLDNGKFVFAMRQDCPNELLSYESELSERIKIHYGLA